MEANDAEARIAGSAAIGRELGARRKFWSLLLTHTLLTGACIAYCVYTLQKASEPPQSPKDKGIYLNMKKDSNNSGPILNFSLTWKEGVELYHGSELKVQYPGPYILYICATVNGDSNDIKANLTLKQGERKTTFELQAEVDLSKLCVRQERLISLYEQDPITFSLYQPEAASLNLRILRIGLHYMLGEKLFRTPKASEGA